MNSCVARCTSSSRSEGLPFSGCLRLYRFRCAMSSFVILASDGSSLVTSSKCRRIRFAMSAFVMSVSSGSPSAFFLLRFALSSFVIPQLGPGSSSRTPPVFPRLRCLMASFVIASPEPDALVSSARAGVTPEEGFNIKWME